MKKFLSMTLFILLLTGAIASMSVIGFGATEDFLIFELSDDGTMYQVKDYCGGHEDVVIPSQYNNLPVTRIAPAAFSYSSVKSVSIPDTVTSIGSSAFHDCRYLESVTVPDSVKSIGDHAFYYCTSLKSIKIPDGVTSICDDTFAYCRSLTSVTIPDSVKTIGDYAFENCEQLTSIDIPEGVTSIGIQAFCCTDFTSVTIPDRVTSLGSSVFFRCKKLESITIGNSVESIGEGAFGECTSLTSITIPGSVKTIDNEAFNGCSALDSIEISEGVASIERAAFYNCPNLKSVTIPNSVTNIGDRAFGYKYSSWEEKDIKIDGFTIFGFRGYTAEKYANDNEFNFVKAECNAHTLSDWVVEEKATVSIAGSKYKNCTVCGDVLMTETIYSPNIITLSKTAYTYDGNVQMPSVTVKDSNGNELVNDTDYTVTYDEGRKDVGTYNVNITFIGNYTGTKTLSFDINPIDISTCNVKLSATSYTYNGSVKTPAVTVINSFGTKLTKDTHYTLTYSNGRKTPGKYSVKIKMQGNYTGTKTLHFNILPSKTKKITPSCSTTSISANWSKVTGATGYKVELLNSKDKVIKSATTTKTSYTFSKLSKVTAYKVRVTAYKTIDKKAVYSSVSTTITTSTAPTAATFSKVTAGNKRATLAWKAVNGASGYEVMYSTSSKFKSAKTATVKKGSSTKITVKKLTKGKTYYFKIRAYKTVNGNKVYSSWSSVKSVKVK